MANSVPTLTGLNSAVTFLENTVNASGQIIDSAVVFDDDDNNFDGGRLTVSNLLPEDIVSIRNQGSGTGQVGLSSGNVTFQGVVIGTATGGVGTTFSVVFNGNATAAEIDAVIQNLTYANSSDTPTASRTLELKITDDDRFAAIAPVTFAQQTGGSNPFNGIDVGNQSSVSFGDIDGDGDLDAVVAEVIGPLNYFRNDGTATAPDFNLVTGAANPFASINLGRQPVFGDLDGDGDLDAVMGDYDGTIHYLENTGSPTSPSFTERTGSANPFNGVDVGRDSAPALGDLDGDGDLDAVVGEFDGVLNYFRNAGTVLDAAFTQQTGAANPFNAVDVGTMSQPDLADLDGDGDLDAVVGEFAGVLNYFSNTGTALVPGFTQQIGTANPFNGFVVGNRITPAFGDVDADGDFDLAAGEFDGNVNYFRNTQPRAIAPDFAEQTGAANPFNGDDAGVSSMPGLADLNGDGDLDAVVGTASGLLSHYRNTGTPLAPVFALQGGAANPFNGVDVGSDSAPYFVDLDADGDLDAVIGEFNGTLNYYENTGTALAPTFVRQIGEANPFDGEDVGDNSVASFADLDGDGDLDAVIGEFSGTLNFFENTGGGAGSLAFTERTGAANPFDGVDVGLYSAPALADLDGDGDLDAVVGENDGVLNYFENTGTALAPVFVQRTGTANPFNGFDVGSKSSPSFADLDHDGDLDLVVGENDGTLHYFRNTGSGFALVVNVTAQNDAATARNDAFTVTEFTDSLFGTLLGDNGSGPDDPDGGGPAFSVTAVNSNPADVGTEIQLSSGAELRVDANGFFDYSLNNVFDSLPGPGSGASNTSVNQTFTYTITGGSIGVVIVTITGLDSADTLNGTFNSDTMFGGILDDTLNGFGNNDTLDGGTGADQMFGGTGNDTYFVDNAGDAVTEGANEGNDVVQSSVDFTLPANVESVLLLAGAGNINAAGNDDPNFLGGNSNNNTLDGKGGKDTMAGGAGDDIYFIDSTGETVTENPKEGNDIVHATVDYTIEANVESVILDGTGNINAAGNDDPNALVGNSGNNTLDGKGGNDTMIGGDGDDIYIVDSTSDVIQENLKEGNDIAFASADFTIGANVESVVLVEGAGDINASGSNDDNALVGNSDDNGLDGKGGRDLLTGNGGNDTFVFASGEANGDAVVDFAGNGAAAGDSLRFVGFGTAAQGATFTQLNATQWQIHSGLDGHNEVITLQNGAAVNASDVLFV